MNKIFGKAPGGRGDGPGLFAAEWVAIFAEAGVLDDGARGRPGRPRARQTRIGRFLARNLDREVRIDVDGRPALAATLRRVEAGQRRRRYYFEIAFEGGDHDPRRSQARPQRPRRRRIRSRAEPPVGMWIRTGHAPAGATSPAPGLATTEVWD